MLYVFVLLLMVLKSSKVDRETAVNRAERAGARYYEQRGSEKRRDSLGGV